MSFFSYYMDPRIISLHTIFGTPDHFLRRLLYMGPLRSVSSHTIWGSFSGQFHSLLYGPPPPQISFFACYRGGGGGHHRFQFFHKI